MFSNHSLMNQKVFFIEFYEEPLKTQIKENIIWAGGTVKSKFEQSITHLITPFESSKNYQKVQKNFFNNRLKLIT